MTDTEAVKLPPKGKKYSLHFRGPSSNWRFWRTAGPPVTDTEAVKLPSMEKTTASVLGGTTTRWRSRTVWSPTQKSKSYSRGRANLNWGQCCGSGDFLSLKIRYVSSKSNKQQIFFKLLFVGILKVNDENSRIRIRIRIRINKSEAWIRGSRSGSRSGSTPKCHGSAILTVGNPFLLKKSLLFYLSNGDSCLKVANLFPRLHTKT